MVCFFKAMVQDSKDWENRLERLRQLKRNFDTKVGPVAEWLNRADQELQEDPESNHRAALENHKVCLKNPTLHKTTFDSVE